MNLLPKSDIDFAKGEYWNKFFRERGTKEFEWYGEFVELCGELHKYLKKDDLILVVGCGNSMLSSDLFDIGYRHIRSIDISSVVIKQMKNKVGKERPELIFEEMDALNMSYEKENFNVVIDKGTLDALMPTDTTVDAERGHQLFSEVDRVLKINGRYIIISLLQNHILREILNYFSKRDWMVRISRCWDVEKRKIEETGCLHLPVFMVVCVKLRKQVIKSVLEVNIFANIKPERITCVKEVMSLIDQVQNTIIQYRETRGEIQFQFFRHGENTSRYSIYIVDGSQDQRHLMTYAAFIVPHGRESEWMFGTEEGRKYLRNSSGFDRLAVIHFHRNQKYGAMDEIQDELRLAILQLAPCLMPISTETPKVPYLTVGDGLGCRRTIYSGTSEHSGEIVVEEVEIDNETFRRLIFMSNQAVVQSEVKIKKVTGKAGNKKVGKKVIDWSHIGSNHIVYMSIPAAMLASERSELSVAVIGLGGGGLCVFLHKLFPRSGITGVEIDPVVVKIAKEYFGFNVNKRLQVVVQDGLDFLKNKYKYDVIAFDVDSKEKGSAMSCPPPQFLEPSVLKAVAEALGTDGVFVTNVVSRVSAEREKLLKKIEKHFALISCLDLKEDVNMVVFASNLKNVSKSEWQQRIKDAAEILNRIAHEKLKPNVELLDLNHLINGLKI